MRKSIYLLTTTPSNHTHLLLTTIVIHTLNFAQVQSMDDNCGEWVECMGVASGCGEQEVGVATGCGCKEVYRFPHTTYPSLLLLYLFFFCSSIPTFCSFFFFKCFSFLFQYFFVIKFYVLNNFPTQFKHTYGQLRASHGSYMKAAHNILYMKKHTQTYASYPAMDISCMTSRSVV